MHTRQSGAAHVPIMFFLILLVMFLGALGFAWVTVTKNGDLIKQKEAAEAIAKTLNEKALLVDHYIADIGKVIGKPGTYTGRESSRGSYGDARLDSEGVMNPDEVKKVIDDAASQGGVSIAIGLENSLGALVTHVRQLEKRASDAELERDKQLTEKTEVDSKFRTATTETAATAAAFSQGLEQARAEFQATAANNANLINTLQNNLKTKDTELAEARELAVATEKTLRAEIAKHKMQNSALTSRESLRQPEDVADGKIVVAKQGVTTAFINLGKKDLLQLGTTFRVKNARSKDVKGYATVTRVEDEKAEVELSGITEPVGDWVREGDMIYHDLYTPGMSRTIYLMGRFNAPYNKDALATLLRRLGNRVVTKMGPGVDTVILGDDPLNEAGDAFAQVSESAEYKEAVDLRVEFATLRKIRDLVKL